MALRGGSAVNNSRWGDDTICPTGGGFQGSGDINRAKVGLSGTNVAGMGTPMYPRVTNFFSGFSGEKWIREDRGDWGAAFVTANPGYKRVGIVPSAGLNSYVEACDAVELDNEPWWSGTDPTAWSTKMLGYAQTLKGSFPTKTVILPLLCFEGTGGGFNGFDNNANYTFSGTTHPWVTWIDNAAPTIWQYCDAFSIHTYNPYITSNSTNFPGGARFHAINTVRTQLEAITNAKGKKFWVTEFGWATDGWHGGGDWYTTEANQSQWTQDYINQGRQRSDIEILMVYQPWDRGTSTANQGDSEFHYGLLRNDESQKPVYAAVRSLL